MGLMFVIGDILDESGPLLPNPSAFATSDLDQSARQCTRDQARCTSHAEMRYERFHHMHIELASWEGYHPKLQCSLPPMMTDS
ncbi:hypothetical protein V6N13_026090 [Hibiscus sabdariffa]